ncbi:type VII secretion-associated serine protease mycosin [Streptomyces sp. 549]|uniref:type VII secretion-associated serine protease mycosin n=1 Tax=Streptomyces sp. 549 TaxID=3049076 RepID=UPI0024C37C1E|nr:type VII secretion-associated serine protease mycosin [Streptomyces sp. 549]MDK1475171.1 type VII secretion-associated serine protease mycosin [Streptomyces sp. 549]
MRARARRAAALTTLTAFGVLLLLGAAPTPAPAAAPTTAHAPSGTRLAAVGECTYPAKSIAGRPWSLQRVQLDRLWEDTKGAGVKVAVIDSGVDVKNPQLKSAVDVSAGADVLGASKENPDAPTGPTADPVGHGTKVAGIIAARPNHRTGFVGIAPEATIIPIRQNDGEGNGKVTGLIKAIDHAVAKGARVINISQDTTGSLGPGSQLHAAVQRALEADVVVVASVGNDGADGKSRDTYPASYDGVLAVAASDRNNERAAFSQSGEFVGIAAPGVDIVSTVPGGGQCADNGTSFAAPFVAGVAALVRAKHPKWSQEQVVAQLQNTAERAVSGRDRHVGWGVIDPVRALTEDDKLPSRPASRDGVRKAEAPEPAPLHLGESYAERNERLGTYTLLTGVVLVAVLAGAALVQRDWRRRHPRE